jgi:lipopolysaccharide transport system ATP-binding protein
MPPAMISVENLSKRYLVGHREQRGGPASYTALRDVIAQELRNFGRKAGDLMRGRQVVQGDTIEEFWALKDVSFEVREGEVLGIVGRNGAGKSTLLKVLSRITEPTMGRVTLRGRIASLLEVGTGFHPELSGRENIYLNGAILGMGRAEIRRKFDEIVAFAEVERFLDTPVKRYSSGMYVRLAFAVAAHLEPEILIVDEVLAVGDAEFQKKCLGKMSEVSSQGRTVLFVSHNMSAVLQLTQRAIVMAGGNVVFAGDSQRAVERYLASGDGDTLEYDVRNARRVYHGTGDARITHLRFDGMVPRFETNDPIRFSIGLLAKENLSRVRVSLVLHRRDGSPVGASFSRDIDGVTAGTERELSVVLPPSRLAPGGYFCEVAIGKGDNVTGYINYDGVMETLYFDVMQEQNELGLLTEWQPSWGPISLDRLEVSWASSASDLLIMTGNK